MPTQLSITVYGELDGIPPSTQSIREAVETTLAETHSKLINFSVAVNVYDEPSPVLPLPSDADCPLMGCSLPMPHTHGTDPAPTAHHNIVEEQ
jgi:hypothetical protein